MSLHPNGQVPFSYVYSPITLPILRALIALPGWLSLGGYWLLYALGLAAQIWAGLQAADRGERRYFVFFAPVAAFFPGFLASDILWSGNVAFLLYGAVLFCAVRGWLRGDWTWFYIATVLASCVKAPLLSLLVLPPLSARRQWVRAGVAGLCGVGLFAIQPIVWPTLFKNYLEAVELQFSYNRDFGCSPAGLLSGFLFDRGIPYLPTSYIFYFYYAVPVFVLLVYLSRQYLAGRFSLQQWIPVLLVGVILLNPRILEYDEILLALPLALIGWRFFASVAKRHWAAVSTALVFLGANCIAYQNWNIWKLTEGPLLVAFFAAGCWNLLRLAYRARRGGNAVALDNRDTSQDRLPAFHLQASNGS